MNKKLLFILLLLSIIITGCNNKVLYKNLNIYFPNESYEYDIEKVSLKSTTKNELVEELRNALIINDKENDNQYYANNIVIKKVELTDDTLNVYLEGKWKEITIADRTLIRNGIIKSYANFEFIDKVKFFVNDLEMEDEYSKKMETIKISDVVNASANSLSTNVVVCNLYFALDNKLVIEERTFEKQSTSLLAQNVIDELISGPNNDTLVSVIPKSTKVKKIEIKDGICYLDLNKQFVTKHPGGELQETLTLYSIVNTLTELDGINAVQFLIDGEKVDEYKGNYDFSMPFNRNEAILSVEE